MVTVVTDDLLAASLLILVGTQWANVCSLISALLP